MQRKSFGLKDVQWKADQPGAFRARIATLNVVDHDGDVTIPGAFQAGKSIVISAYMHSSWIDKLPVGKGVIGANDSEAWVDGQFFTDTSHGMDTYKTIKALADAGLGEWSYGYEVMSSSTEKADLDPYPGAMRMLKGLNTFEASPVLIGAGINTATEAIKARATAVSNRLKAMTPDANTIATIAQLDVLADKISTDACEMDAMITNLMQQLGIPDPDDAAEADMTEAGMDIVASDAEEPNPSVYGINHGLSYRNQAKHAQASVQAFVSRSKSLADLRAKEGRTLSAANRDRLNSLMSALTSAATDIQDLLNSTDDGKANAEIEAIWLGLQRQSLAA